MRYIAYFGLIFITILINSIAQKLFKEKWNLWAGYGIPIFLMMLFLLTPPGGGLGDFNKAYYPAGRLIFENPYKLYDETCRTFVNLPIIALLFVPFSFTYNPDQARMAFTIVGSLFIFIAYSILANFVKIRDYRQLAVVGIFAINGPLYYSLRQGNTTHFLLLILTLVIVCLQEKREIWTGILLGIAALMKPFLLLPCIYFAVRQRWRLTAAVSATLLSVVAASVLLLGSNLNLLWLNRCIYAFSGKVIGAFNVQSVDGFLYRLLTDGDLTNFIPTDMSWNFKLFRYGLLLILVGMPTWILWRTKPPKTVNDQNLEFSIVLCLSLLISPISWTHYYLLLLLPFSLYLGDKLAIPKGWIWSSSMIVSLVLVSPPVISFNSDNFLIRFFVSHYFIGGVVLLGTLLAARWQTSPQIHHFNK
ncbi:MULTISPECIES: glycosyltransferase family 87 protein [unclassified Coleofasciculus]|uniref:glycosyltransferase family 87 protein n=1 Tax=unclassified Coleofasciculus TaxID=2692782 RepID=UPI00187F07F0|nr:MULTISPECIES: glycosyltransferase family 87 protein [unclassified Coleofasciculus]MBE9125743.1 DUF2029 domain-containing protein [Coleofasciculus sp. LEGE 07081]MBE9147231.1 DUF2029 domain-containing protein [Coleofasciculus sp. LEGE 07092]